LLRVSVFLSISLCCIFAFGLDFPPPPKQHVNDYAGALSTADIQEIDDLLSGHEKETSNQIVIAIFPTLDDESLEDFTNRLFEKWGIGQKANNNGVLLAIFMKEQRVRIEVGYGLESKLTDALSSRIIRNEIAPAFRERQYGAGIRAAVLAIEKAIAREYNPAAGSGEKQPESPPVALFLFVLIVLYILYRSRNTSQTYRRRRGGWWWFLPPGGWGGGGDSWGSSSGGSGWSGGGGSSGGGGASGGW
jgi:uncharacterized protein